MLALLSTQFLGQYKQCFLPLSMNRLLTINKIVTSKLYVFVKLRQFLKNEDGSNHYNNDEQC